jgi:hypothetical protein
MAFPGQTDAGKAAKTQQRRGGFWFHRNANRFSIGQGFGI